MKAMREAREVIMNRLLFVLSLAVVVVGCSIPTIMDSHADQHLSYEITKIDGQTGFSWSARMSSSSGKGCAASDRNMPIDIKTECGISESSGTAETIEAAKLAIEKHFEQFVADNHLQAPASK